MLFPPTRPLLFVSKVFFQAGLLALFGYFFGLPAVSRYLSKEVLTVTTNSYPGKIPNPSVTVVIVNSSWVGLEKACGDSENIKSCIVERTRSLPDTIHAELGQSASLMAPELWREDFTYPFYGRSYTLLYPNLRGNNWRTDDIVLHVNNSDGLTRRIFIHDPDFFVVTTNPLTLPISTLILTPSMSGRFYYSLALREHRQLNTPTNPCMEDPAYSFTTCVKESLSRDTGCRLPWDRLSDGARPECTALGQFQAFASNYTSIEVASMREIYTKTKCHKPCRSVRCGGKSFLMLYLPTQC